MRRHPAVSAIATAGLCALALVGAPVASAADVLSPVDGETVSSRPSFNVDFAAGSIDIELAHSPETLTAGDRAGAFVEPVRENFMLIGRAGQSPGVADWGLAPPLNAGRYLWHAQLNDYATEEARGFRASPWGPPRTLSVADEPPVIEGWSLHGRRSTLRGCAARYRYAYTISGAIVWNDNAERATARYTITLRHSSGKATRFAGQLLLKTATFSHRLCTNVSSARAELRLTDPAAHVVRGLDKRLRLRG